MNLIETEADVAEGAAWLAACEPRFALALLETGPLPLRLREGGFSALLRAIVSQQISVAAAAGVWARLEAAGATEAKAVAQMDVESLRAAGLSRQKAGYALALAQAGVDFAALRQMPSDEVIATLVRIKGIGVWTAEIYAKFSLGHADVLAAGDLALQESARMLFDLPARPTERELRKLAEPWSPWRSVAARALWSYYHVMKNREGIGA
ncbi:DNA-3-methyladenine glycosylase 2 family protein [Abyssibius alkaniclasticus]|uniref:DNA-3-methyladenine glycosylase family protein n=1 Tax=Abyssibius alkaniclasticus TaxID=2881234 RepID=UPI0023643C81|nr:DNA-3-methyladenine glycosylase 2 family protein [Abyssibius alkaniclasticus]UPH70474.1 DNA-3-methyladenine glycosylase 2 family protein [Abyssibius alkaniclasticus]